MSVKLQVILLLLFGMAFVFLINHVRKRTVALKYALAWLLLDAVLIVLVLFPKLLQIIAGALGIASPMNMMFFCGFALSLVVIYTLTMALSRNAENLRELIQREALNDYRIRRLERHDEI